MLIEFIILRLKPLSWSVVILLCGCQRRFSASCEKLVSYRFDIKGVNALLPLFDRSDRWPW